MRRLVDVRYAGRLVAQLPGCRLRRNRRPVVFLMWEPRGDADKILALQSWRYNRIVTFSRVAARR